MEIGSTPSSPEVSKDIRKVDIGPARAQGHSPAPASVPPAGDDSVNLTADARQMQNLQSAVAATPTMDSGRVAALREAIANGSYPIDPQRIADSLLAQDRAVFE